MIAVIQRVLEASVRVEDRVVAQIGPGILVLVGVAKGDQQADADTTAAKIAALRMFEGRTPMDHAVKDHGGSCLVVSQFTLVARLFKGNRPSFDSAETPAAAKHLYERVIQQLRAADLNVEHGQFGADMKVSLVNDGPVTFIIETSSGALVRR